VEGWYGQPYRRPLERTREYIDILRLATASPAPGPDTFDVVGGPLAIVADDDLERAADRLRPTLALYIGGMGARGVNFHHEVFARMGYEAEAKTISPRPWPGRRPSPPLTG